MPSVLESIALAASPYPTIDLTKNESPRPGTHHDVPKICKRSFARGECSAFYQQVANGTGRLQCPKGFSAWPVRLGQTVVAVTAIVGSPRMGSEQERLRAKEYPESRVSVDRVEQWISTVAELVITGDEARNREFSRRFDALHEIRRLNQIVKTNAERACNRESPDDPDKATDELVRTFRASELISVQLDALDLLANPAAMTFKPRRWIFYKTVDKIVRLYRVIADGKRIRLRLSGTSAAEAMLDQRTIHIIPSVFVDNAVKYSAAGDTVDVRVTDEMRDKEPVITVEVVSEGPPATADEQRQLFHSRGRGAAARAIAEGSGVGLSLAKVVADQHNGFISVDQQRSYGSRSTWRFRFSIPAARVNDLKERRRR